MFIDLTKAFDIVIVLILLKHLRSLGIRGVEISWHKSNLSDRNKYMEIYDSISFQKCIICSNPQSSILGLIIFLIHDLPNPTNMKSMLGFAGGIDVSTSASDVSHFFNLANTELLKLFGAVLIN